MNELRCPIELRADDSGQSPGRLVGTLLTYGERASDRPELFEPNSLVWADRGIVINRQHVRSSPVLRAVPEVRGLTVVVDTPLPDTTAGREAAQEILGGLFTGMSIEFKAQRQRFENGIRCISSAMLLAAALVDSPSFANSLVEIRGAYLAEVLTNLIGDQDQDKVIQAMAASAGITVSTVRQILAGEVDVPPLNRLQSFAEVLGIPVQRLLEAVLKDGGSPSIYGERRRRLWL